MFFSKRSHLALVGLLSLLFGCDSSGPYRKTDGAWRYRKETLEGAPTSVTPLNGDFARGDGRVWYHSTTIDGADAATFEALDGHYAKDARQVYYGDTYRNPQEYYLIRRNRVRVIDGARAAAFAVLKDGYARDGGRVYYEGAPIAARDVASYEVLDYGFTRDRRTGYYHRDPVPGSDGATFAVLDANYARDSAHAFYSFVDLRAQPPVTRHVRVEGADLTTLEPLRHDYAKDARRVYWRGRPVADADVATFAPLDVTTDSADATDRGGSFKDGRRR